MLLRKMGYILASLILMLTMVNCEPVDLGELDPDTPVFQDYYILYDRTDNITEAKATFRVKGDRIRLSGNSSVSFNGEKKENTSLYWWRGEGIQNVEVNFIKNPKESFVNLFEANNALDIDFKDDFDELSLGNKNTVGWKGEPLRKNETIRIELLQGTASFMLRSSNGPSTVEIEDLAAEGVSKGEATIVMLRELTIDNLDHTDKKAGGRVTYATRVNKNITITGNNE